MVRIHLECTSQLELGDLRHKHGDVQSRLDHANSDRRNKDNRLRAVKQSLLDKKRLIH
jgi:hypothetical protein